MLAEYTKSISNFLSFIKNKKINEFLNIDGIGDTQINSLKKFFDNKSNYKIIEKLSSILNIYDLKLNKSGKLLNNTFMFTGKLSNMSRAEAKSLIEENSGSVVSSVNKKEKNYLFKYHFDVYNNISPFLNKNEKKWLAKLI